MWQCVHRRFRGILSDSAGIPRALTDISIGKTSPRQVAMRKAMITMPSSLCRMCPYAVRMAHEFIHNGDHDICGGIAIGEYACLRHRKSHLSCRCASIIQYQRSAMPFEFRKTIVPVRLPAFPDQVPGWVRHSPRFLDTIAEHLQSHCKPSP